MKKLTEKQVEILKNFRDNGENQSHSYDLRSLGGLLRRKLVEVRFGPEGNVYGGKAWYVLTPAGVEALARE